MSKKEYTKEQLKELLNNPYVKDCSIKYITFTDDFKVKALELDAKGIYHRQIFQDFGFPDYIYSSKIVPQSLGNWRHKFKTKGLHGLINTQKGRKKKEVTNVSKMTLKEEIEYFKTENAFLKEMYKLKHGQYP